MNMYVSNNVSLVMATTQKFKFKLFFPENKLEMPEYYIQPVTNRQECYTCHKVVTGKKKFSKSVTPSPTAAGSVR